VWVLDASVAVRWLLAAGAEPDAERVMERVVEQPRRFAVPELFAFETFSVIARHHSDPLGAFGRSVLPVLNSGILRQPMSVKLAEAAMPFVARGLTGYDACYAGLASMVGGTWLTFDGEAHRRLAGTGVSFLLGHGVPAEF
jgi:predicted nucleic acid-binding protein